jgi:hypothetical protein
MARCVCWRAAIQSQRGRIVGNGNFDIDKKGPIGGLLRPGNSPRGEPQAGFDDENHSNIEQGKTCGAMSEQHDRSHESSPQKFIHLIGCRDPNAVTRTRTHPRSHAQKP